MLTWHPDMPLEYRDAIVTGDALLLLERVPPQSIDVIVTDPPFFMPAQIHNVRTHWPRSLGDLAVMEGYFRIVFAGLVKCLRPTGALYVFSDSTSYAVFSSLLYPLFDRTQCIVWDKGVGGLGNGWRHSHELITHGARTATRYTPDFRRDIIVHPVVPSADRWHPAEKPIGLIAELLKAHPPGTVFDPFAGSAAVAVAARLLGSAFVAFEIDPETAERARHRVEQTQPPLFVMQPEQLILESV